jgi:hypothetical protein
MQQWWIPARDAYDAIAKEAHGETYIAICSRALEGLLQARARRFVTERGTFENAQVPAQFWWAKGHAALEQNWNTGDFSTWIEDRFEWKAFGVEFDFFGLKQMLSPLSGAELARQLSVISSPDWISAREARQFAWERLGANPVAAGDVLIQHLKLGFVAGRAVLMQGCRSKDDGEWEAEEREWDIPDWYWESFVGKESSSQDWAQGKFSGRGLSPDGLRWITLSGVHFSASALRFLASGPSDDPHVQVTQNKGGRPRKEWWDDLWCAVWGDVYRGDLKPKSQAEIERAMMDWAIAQDESVSESTLKPLARKMFVELQR